MNLRPMMQMALLAALTGILAYLRIPLPFTPVPITGQTIGVMLAGILLGWRWGAASMGIYLLLGLAGAPVFAGGSAGLGVLLGLTGGYIWGFVLAAAVVGFLARPSRSLSREYFNVAVACVVGGMLVVYAAGSLHYAAVAGTSVGTAVAVTVLPFIAGDAFKVVVATLVGVAVRRALRRHHLLAEVSAPRYSAR